MSEKAKLRFFVSDISRELLVAHTNNKRMLDTFWRHFDKESDADVFIAKWPSNKKYMIHSEGKVVLSITER